MVGLLSFFLLSVWSWVLKWNDENAATRSLEKKKIEKRNDKYQPPDSDHFVIFACEKHFCSLYYVVLRLGMCLHITTHPYLHTYLYTIYLLTYRIYVLRVFGCHVLTMTLPHFLHWDLNPFTTTYCFMHERGPQRVAAWYQDSTFICPLFILLPAFGLVA